LSGALRVCAAVTFSRNHIVPALRSFLAEHPEMRSTSC
jgi:DNA-binding transcriptional LysR family regulator